MTIQIIELKQLPDLPEGWMRAFTEQGEAERYAAKNAQPFVWHFANNKTYYVAESEKEHA